MARPQPADVKRVAPRLYLVTPAIDEASGFVGLLGGVIEAAEIAAVLLRLARTAERDMINRVKALAPAVQDKDAALILDGQPDLAARSGADGAHLTGIAAFTAAVETLKPARIAGCGGLKTRHDAMLAAERGADYVMFGEVEPSGRRPSFAAIIERVEWWVELFEIPCVGFATSLDEVKALVAAGADFIALGEFIWNDPRGVAAAVAEVADQLATPEAVP
jgi:thiamine-phosphate pyrophosphorylase